jgi:hypothetical protein
VAGAIVTFSIEGGKAATFGGASTLTVATNAAGQAAVTGLTPSAAGAFQIQVSAAFQGQVATATIAQTNVLTAAQAAAASAASGGSGSAGGSAGGGAAGGGGGLSTTTIAVAGAAVAGGAVAATQVAKKDDEGGSGPFTGPFTGTTSTTVVSRNSGQNCTITRSISGTITFRSRSNEPTSVSGDLDLNGTATVTATTCVVVNQTNPFGGTLPVSGTQSALRGNASNSSTSSGVSGEVITSNQMLLFDGSMSGNSVTGTLKIEIKAVSTGGGGGPVDSLESGTFSLSLTKS